VPSARRAPREVLPSTATALNRPRASAFACPAARRAHAGRRRPAAAQAAVRTAAGQGPRQGPRVQAVQDHPDRLLIRRPVPAGDRIPRSPQPGQVRLAGPPDPLPDRGEPVIPGRGERADRDRDQTGQRVDPPLRRARSGSASSRCHIPAARSWPPGPDPATRAPTRDNATAGTPHLVHVDLEDLHDRMACPRPSTARFRPISHMPHKTG
jgi:hypothetical protein